MRRSIALALCAFVAGPALAHAPAVQNAPAQAAGLRFVTPAEIDPAILLPAPPADGSPAAKAELAELHRIEARRTPEQFARAKADAATENVNAFDEVMGPGFDLARLPATAKLFADLRHEDHAAAKLAKVHFARTRPWAADPTLHSCDREDAPNSSYPSGHATMAYAAAGVLARLDPEEAPQILSRAADYSENRLVCGVHYRRDIVAGETLGTTLAADLMDNAAFRSEFEAAQSELRQAGVVR